MKTQKSSKKSIIILIAVVAVIGLVYFYYSGGSSTDTGSGLSETQSADSAAVGTRVLTLLQQIKSLRIDTALFQDPAYLNLMDYSVTIPEVEVGRPNPFAPLPGEPAIKVPAGAR